MLQESEKDSSKLPENLRYEYIEKIGMGGFCDVYKARDLLTDQIVAIKKPNKSKVGNKVLFSKLSKLMLKEANIMKDFDHPNIIKLIDFFENEDGVHLIEEYASGGDLFYYLLSKRCLKEFEAGLIISQILSAIKHVHDLGYVHRDIKLENILIMDKYCTMFKLSDFGLSRQVDFMQTICGTVEYSAPELLQHGNNKYYGAEVDSWSIGVITYVLLCGYMPFFSNKKNVYEVKQQILGGNFHFHSPTWDKISPNAKLFISSLLERIPSDRMTISEALQHPWLNDIHKIEKRVSRQRLRCLANCYLLVKHLESILHTKEQNE